MRLRLVISAGIGLCWLFISCHRADRVSLSLDFSQAETWRYMFAIDIAGTVSTPDSTKEFTSSLRTYLAGEHSPHDIGAVRFRTSQPLISSNFLSDEQRQHLERRFENQLLYLSPKEGAVTTSDTTIVPFVNIGGWDLLHSFVRVLPVFPETPQSPGGSWERERTFPIETGYGNAMGWLYQSFTLDSITAVDRLRCAWVSWRFTYRIQPDSAAILDSLPLQGTGNGVALIDLKNRRLVKAHALFEVPAKAGSKVQTSLRETVHLELMN